jgi:Sigma-54 interaction domain
MTTPITNRSALSIVRRSNGDRASEPAALLNPHEVKMFATSRVNCLLIGPGHMVDEALAALTPHFKHRAVILDARHPFELPVSVHPATYVVGDIGALTAAQQAGLSTWIASASGRAQVVSTNPVPLLPAVEAESFLSSLYYRLNTLTFSLVPEHVS